MEQWKDLQLNSRFSGKRRQALDTLNTSTKEISLVFDNFPFFKQLLFSKYDDVRSATIWLIESLLTKEIVDQLASLLTKEPADQLTQDEKQQLRWLSRRIFSEESLFSPSKETEHLLRKSGNLIQKQYKDPINVLLNDLIEILRNMDKAIFIQSLNILTWFVLYSSPQVNLSTLQEILIAEITKKNDKTIAHSIILAGTLGNQSMIDLLIKFHQQEKLTNHGNKTVCLALGKSKHPQAKEYFFSIVDRKEKPALIYPILLGLSYFSDEEVSNLFFELLKKMELKDAFASKASFEPATSIGKWTFFKENVQIFGMGVSSYDAQYAMEHERKYAKEKYDDASATSAQWLLLTIDTLGKHKFKSAIPKLLDIAFFINYPLDAKKAALEHLIKLDTETAIAAMLSRMLDSEFRKEMYFPKGEHLRKVYTKGRVFSDFVEKMYKMTPNPFEGVSQIALELLQKVYNFNKYLIGESLGTWSDLHNTYRPETKRALSSTEFSTLVGSYSNLHTDIFKNLILSMLAFGTNNETKNKQIYDFLVKCFNQAEVSQLKLNALSSLCAFLRINKFQIQTQEIKGIGEVLGKYPNIYLNRYILSIIKKYPPISHDTHRLVGNYLLTFGMQPNRSETKVQRRVLEILKSLPISNLDKSEKMINFLFAQIQEESKGWEKPTKRQNVALTEMNLTCFKEQAEMVDPSLKMKFVEAFRHVFEKGIISFWHPETCKACKNREKAKSQGKDIRGVFFGRHTGSFVFNEKLISLFKEFVSFLNPLEKENLTFIIPQIKAILKPETLEEEELIQKSGDFYQLIPHLFELLIYLYFGNSELINRESSFINEYISKEEPRVRLKFYLSILEMLETQWDHHSFKFYKLGLKDRENRTRLLQKTIRRKNLPIEFYHLTINEILPDLDMHEEMIVFRLFEDSVATNDNCKPLFDMIWKKKDSFSEKLLIDILKFVLKANILNFLELLGIYDYIKDNIELIRLLVSSGANIISSPDVEIDIITKQISKFIEENESLDDPNLHQFLIPILQQLIRNKVNIGETGRNFLQQVATSSSEMKNQAQNLLSQLQRALDTEVKEKVDTGKLELSTLLEMIREEITKGENIQQLFITLQQVLNSPKLIQEEIQDSFPKYLELIDILEDQNQKHALVSYIIKFNQQFPNLVTGSPYIIKDLFTLRGKVSPHTKALIGNLMMSLSQSNANLVIPIIPEVIEEMQLRVRGPFDSMNMWIYMILTNVAREDPAIVSNYLSTILDALETANHYLTQTYILNILGSLKTEDPRMQKRTFSLMKNLESHTDLNLATLASNIAKRFQPSEPVLTCPFCDNYVSVEDSKCAKCGNPLGKCEICRGIIGGNEKTISCPFCNNNFHSTHFKEWIKTRGTCPVCKEKISSLD